MTDMTNAELADALNDGKLLSRVSFFERILITEAARRLREADAAIARAVDGWQPIETAPKDGTSFLALKGSRHFDCWWHDSGHGEAYWMDDIDSEPDPTHWMPLPAPPAIREADGAIARPCMCAGYGDRQKRQVDVELPDHMVEERARRQREYGQTTVTIDACIIGEIRDLWGHGIRTTGCCCGHNDPAIFSYVGVVEADIPRMKALGYSVRPNSLHPDREDSFAPKSIRHAYYCEARDVPAEERKARATLASHQEARR